MEDINDDTNHMDICQGKAFHDVISNYNMQSAKGRNEIFKLIFDKKHGAIGGMYDDFKKFDTLYPNEAKIFECGIEQTCKFYSYFIFHSSRKRDMLRRKPIRR